MGRGGGGGHVVVETPRAQRSGKLRYTGSGFDTISEIGHGLLVLEVAATPQHLHQPGETRLPGMC